MIYTAESLSSATLEIMVYIPFYDVLKNYVCIPIDFNDRLLKSIPLNELPENWQYDPVPESCRAIGDKWVKNQEPLVLKIPSVIIPVDYNYLFNLVHPYFNKIVVRLPKPFKLDERLIK